MMRFSAKLLFQYRVVGVLSARFVCEERIVTFKDQSFRAAVNKSFDLGRGAEHRYKNEGGDTVAFELVGVVDVLELGVECESNEVWYEVFERIRPMERKKVFVKSKSELLAREKKTSEDAGQ